MKFYIIILGVGIIIITLVGMYLFYYGFTLSFPPCQISEEVISVPNDLKSVVFVASKQTPVFQGDDGEGLVCTKTLSNYDRFVVPQEYASSYQKQGLIRPLVSDEQLVLRQIIKTEAHGFWNSMFSSEPLIWLILENGQGDFYRVNTAFLGTENEESFLKAWRNRQLVGSLIWGMDEDGTEIIKDVDQ